MYDTIPSIRSISSAMPKLLLEGELKNTIKETSQEIEALESGEIYTLPIVAHDKIMRVLKIHDSIQKTNQYIDRFFINEASN